MSCRRSIFSKVIVAVFSVAMLYQCGGKVIDTQYSRNKAYDKENPMSQDDFIAAIGQDKYNILVNGMGEDALNLLAYGTGQSNMIELINSIIDPNKLPLLLLPPYQLTPEETLELINLTDWHIQQGRTHPTNGSIDTVAKMANLINAVNDMNALKMLVKGAKDNNLGPAYAQTKFQRLSMMIAMTDELSSTMPTIINDVMSIESPPLSGNYIANTLGRDVLLATINGTNDLNKLITVVNEIQSGTGISNMTGVLINLTHNGTCSNVAYTNQFDCEQNAFTWTGDGTSGSDALIATMNNVTDASKMSYLVNNLNQVIANSNDDNFDGDTACNGGGRAELTAMYYAINNMESGANAGKPSWYSSSSNALSGCSAQSDPTLADGETAAVELTTQIYSAGNISFNYRVSSETTSSIQKVKVTQGGNGYTSPPTVAFSGGGGSGAAGTAVISSGVITKLTLTNPGSGYTSNPTVAFSGGGGSGASAVATRQAVGVSSISVTNGGSGYTSAPTVNITGGGGAGGATATANMDGYVSSVSLTNSGSGYTSNPTCNISGSATCSATRTFKVASITGYNTSTCYDTSSISCSLSGGGGSGATCSAATTSCSCGTYCTGRKITGVTVTNAGSGYTSAPTVSFPGSSSGGTANMTYDSLNLTLTNGGSGYASAPSCWISGGGGSGATCSTALRYSVSSVTVTAGGSYTSAPSVSFTGGGGSGATATANVPGSPIQLLTIISGGSGYTTNPTVSFSGGGGTGAAATATASPTAVTAVNLTSAGSGYTSTPTVTLSGGGGSGATAMAVMAGDYLKFFIDDQLKFIAYGNGSWQSYSTAVTTGVHRFRWEYVKDSSGTGGLDQAFIDNLVLPGDKGAGRYAYEKVAILLNQLRITSITNIADIMNGVAYNPGLDNLIEILNTVEYPTSISATPRMVDIVNNLTGVSTMIDMLNSMGVCSNTAYTSLSDCTSNGGTWSSGGNAVKNLVETMNNVGQIDKLYTLVNNLQPAGTGGVKIADIMNPLTSQGANAIVKMMDEMALTLPLDSTDYFNEMLVLVNNLSDTKDVPKIINELSITGANITKVGDSAYPTAGAKLGLVMVKVKDRSVAEGEWASCTTDIQSFCTYNHLVRLVEDLKLGVAGAAAVGRIVSGLDTTIYPSGLDKMVDIMYDLKTQNLASKYDHRAELGNSDAFGRLTTLINEMSLAGATRVAELVNYVNNTSNLTYMVLNSNKIAYMGDMMNYLTSTDLMIDLLNDENTNITRVAYLVNYLGDVSYPNEFDPPPSPRYLVSSQTETNDPLGRMTAMINDISGGGISNVITLINNTNDLSYLGELIKQIGQVRFLSDTTNKVVNIDLMVKVFNGYDTVGICSVGEQYNASSSACTAAGYSYNSTVNWCSTGGSYSTEASCTGAGYYWIGVQLPKLLRALDKIGNSTVFGGVSGGKAVGDMTMMADIVNELGYNGAVPRPVTEQVKVVNLMNAVEYCGVKPAYDLSITYGPTCSISAYNNKVACLAAGGTWSNESQMYACNDSLTYAGYDPNVDVTDYRPRLVTVVLGLNNAQTMATITGDVTDTQKTINVMNGTRRINTIIWTVNLMPGEVGAKLINDTERPAIFRSFVYLSNNLDPNEYTAAQAFASMIHYGTGIVDSTNRYNTSPCTYYTAIGPHRVAQLMNAEVGTFLEAVILMTGWRTLIPALVCGAGTPNTGEPQYIARDYPNNPMPTATGQNIYRTDSIVTSQGTFTYQQGGSTRCQAYYPETASGGVWPCTISEAIDKTIWQGAGACGINVDPGLGGLWDVLKGRGIVAWLLDTLGGTIGTPPTVNCANCGTTQCYPGSAGNEWDCIKNGVRNGNLATSDRWGNYCTVPLTGAVTPANCTGAGGRWIPFKDYVGCRIDPFVHQPVQASTGYTKLNK